MKLKKISEKKKQIVSGQAVEIGEGAKEALPAWVGQVERGIEIVFFLSGFYVAFLTSSYLSHLLFEKIGTEMLIK